MNELIKVEINENDEQVVNAKELYDFLGFDKSQWSRWYKTNILDDELFILFSKKYLQNFVNTDVFFSLLLDTPLQVLLQLLFSTSI